MRSIPGKIISKKIYTKEWVIQDLMLPTEQGGAIYSVYNIFITPFEIIIFKMSGNDDYVNGTEAETFFNSISFKTQQTNSKTFTICDRRLLHIHFPGLPQVTKDTYSTDGIDQWKFEANDSLTGNAYAVYKKTVTNLSVMEEDTFDLSLVEKSFTSLLI